MNADMAATLRRDYEAAGLDEDTMSDDPFDEFRSWFDGVLSAGIDEPNAFVLATVGSDGQPSARAVLMKEFDDTGLVFYTGMTSRKSDELRANPRAAATFVWIPLHRQVRLEGTVEVVDEATADSYFASRPRGAKVAAHASSQSSLVPSRAELESRFETLASELSEDVPRPATWGGWRLLPTSFEFWQGRPNRFHDRIRYRLVDERWNRERLAP